MALPSRPWRFVGTAGATEGDQQLSDLLRWLGASLPSSGMAVEMHSVDGYIYISISYIILCVFVFVLDDDLHRSSSFLRDSAHVMTPPITPQLPPARSDRSKPERCRAEMARWRDGQSLVVSRHLGLLWHQKMTGKPSWTSWNLMVYHGRFVIIFHNSSQRIGKTKTLIR